VPPVEVPSLRQKLDALYEWAWQDVRQENDSVSDDGEDGSEENGEDIEAGRGPAHNEISGRLSLAAQMRALAANPTGKHERAKKPQSTPKSRQESGDQRLARLLGVTPQAIANWVVKNNPQPVPAKHFDTLCRDLFRATRSRGKHVFGIPRDMSCGELIAFRIWLQQHKYCPPRSWHDVAENAVSLAGFTLQRRILPPGVLGDAIGLALDDEDDDEGGDENESLPLFRLGEDVCIALDLEGTGPNVPTNPTASACFCSPRIPRRSSVCCRIVLSAGWTTSSDAGLTDLCARRAVACRSAKIAGLISRHLSGIRRCTRC
jgi:hypothetical protein